MGTISLQVPVSGQPNSTEDPKIASDMSVIQTVINGNIDTNNISSTAGIKYTQIASGAWTAVTLTPNLIAAPGSYTPSSRLQGDTVRLKGAMQNNSGGGSVPSTIWATLPGGMWPTLTVVVPGLGPNGVGTYWTINTAGQLLINTNTANLDIVYLDGITFTIS